LPSSSGSGTAATPACRRSPAASGAGSTSRWESPATPSCCSSPTTGFDPAARRQSWDLIARLRALGKTIVLTTHYMDEAQQLADRVAVIAHGRVIAEGTPDTLGRGTGEAAVVSFRLPEQVELAELPLPPGAALDPADRRLSLRTATPARDLAPLLAWAAERHTELEGLTVTRPSLEDVYLQLTEEPA
jgi:ABC-2 type transport system ATP-binding protein